jgi:hypothetical protein
MLDDEHSGLSNFIFIHSEMVLIYVQRNLCSKFYDGICSFQWQN